MNSFLPESLFEIGFTDLVSVIPPGAVLTPSSKIPPAAIGKIPGRRNANGLWAGYDWRKAVTTLADVKQWQLDGANVGLRADRFPGVDIDCSDPALARIIRDIALAKLGPAPTRTGKAPKQLLMYRLEEAGEFFGRMRVWIERGEEHHLVEVLGQGQQYLIYGTHPSTLQPYRWDSNIEENLALSRISRADADAFLVHLAETLETLGWNVKREGDGRPITRTAGEAAGQEAPSLDILRDAVRVIPNTNDLFPSRADYLRVGYAIKASAGVDEDEGFNIFAEWCAKWEGNGRQAGNDPQVVFEDWRRFRMPSAVGWAYLAEQARAFGFNDAALDFDAVDELAAVTEPVILAASFSDQWLADKIVARQRGRLRYSPEKGCWYVWSEGKWQTDAELLAEDIIKRELRVVADEVLRIGSTPAERKEMQKVAVQICSAGKVTSVASLVRSDRSIAVSMEALDHDIWIINTPSGIVDLRTGELLPHDPDRLCSKSTAVPPDFTGSCDRWKSFLLESTGDPATVAYLQRLCGYALTGSTREEQLTFIHGPGGNGKSKFLGVLAGILADYGVTASMDTFIASNNEKHSTDMAMLAGARLVTASESRAGKRWDEQRVKGLTGGDRISARFMHKNNFTFKPQLKLIFVGNSKPELRDVDLAMKRRIHMLPFTITPAVIDRDLDKKLEAEWPAILAWMIDGCLAWQQHGLVAPEKVKLSTAEYFEEEDGVGRWLKEYTTDDVGSQESSGALFESWSEWANANGEWVGSLKRLASALISRGYGRWQDPKTRRKGFHGLRIDDRQDFGLTS